MLTARLCDQGAKRCVWTGRRAVYGGATRIVMGCYGPFLEELLAHFRRSQLLVETLNEWSRDKRSSLARMFTHIGLQPLSEVGPLFLETSAQ